MLGDGQKLGVATLKHMKDPELFSRFLRFAPATYKEASKIYYQVDDDWVRNFVEMVAAGEVKSLFADPRAILLLPKTVNAGEYRPPTSAEVAATCYRPPREIPKDGKTT